ncbi:hypothetical protein JCM19237_4108 [Photobacterium aphoticum]|uniref:Uroporphyrinogen-III C-methyltransferase n=1 Tax=Photobacterium aphoticum TaxID=754436 RepID=A0A090RAY2_9GAMM|nr:hypothetical protein JCM19237_4108 [Photobacterium aphoticum]
MLPEQRVFRGVLSGLPALVNQHQVCSPALIVVGEVTALSLQHESHLHASHHGLQTVALSA